MSSINKRSRKRARHSLLYRNARIQFVVSLLLISVLPVLTLLYLVLSGVTEGTVVSIILTFLVLLIILGYFLLIKYPVTILRLRRYLEGVAATEVPDKASSVAGENDISAIGKYLDLIVADTKARLVTIKSQQDLLIAAEQHRVMIQSLGAACHHLGQPATVLVAYLDLLGRSNQSEETRKIIADCLAASRDMQDILSKLTRVSEYRTEPYLADHAGRDRDSDRILKV